MVWDYIRYNVVQIHVFISTLLSQNRQMTEEIPCRYDDLAS